MNIIIVSSCWTCYLTKMDKTITVVVENKNMYPVYGNVLTTLKIQST